MLDAWCISIFVGFDFHDVDALRLKGGKEVLTLLFSKLLILCIYGIYIGKSPLARMAVPI